jgi:hypothetical protein
MVGIAESKFHLNSSSVDDTTDYSTTFITHNTMADDGQTSRLDNAGTLQQSVSTSVIHEKVTIVRLKACNCASKWLINSYQVTKLIIRHVHSVYGRRIIP